MWEHGGAYFGVPRRNYLAGWRLRFWCIDCGLGVAEGGAGAHRDEDVCGAAGEVYAFFAARYVRRGWIPALQLIAMFSMGVPGLLALLQIYLNRSEGSGEG